MHRLRGSESFLVSRSLINLFQQPDFASSDEAKLVSYLAAYIRQHSDIEKSVVALRTDNWKHLAQMVQSTRVAAKVEKLLRFIGEHSVTVTGAFDYPLVDAGN